MTAYTVIQLDIHDAEVMAAYEAAMADLVPRSGGRLLARDTDATTLDGSWSPALFVLIEFPNKESILRFYDSEEYAPLKDMRHRSANSEVIAVSGIEVADAG